jgi:hypothetical protein
MLGAGCSLSKRCTLLSAPPTFALSQVVSCVILYFTNTSEHNKTKNRISEVSPSSVIYDVNFLLHKHIYRRRS